MIRPAELTGQVPCTFFEIDTRRRSDQARHAVMYENV
jgi:hypothetical protein